MLQTSEIFLTFVRRLIFCFFLIVLGATASHAQESGHVGITTRLVPVFTTQSTTTHSAILPDFGYASQMLFYCTTAFNGTVDFEFSPTGPTGPTFYPLAQTSFPGSSPDTGCHQLQLGQYWPNLRVTVTPSAGSLSAWYTASAAPISFFASGISSMGAASPIVCDQSSVTSSITTASTSLVVSPLNSGDVVIICGFTVAFSAATSAGAVTLGWAPTSGCSTFSTWQVQTTASTPQLFSVPYAERSPTKASQFACFTNNSGATAVVSLSWASVHGL